MENIYFDNASTTKALDVVIEKAAQIASTLYGNPSSSHHMGIEIDNEIKTSKQAISRVLNVKPEDIYFTSGATESNNMAILGAARAYARDGNHVITASTEHPSVYECYKQLELEGFDVTYLPVNKKGYVDNELLRKSITSNTILVSLMHVNNETGLINDIEVQSAIVKEMNRNTVFHCDGVQGFCKHKLKMHNVDMYSASAHKQHGLKGTGILYIKKGIKLKPLLYGGGQQDNIRPGTENTLGIVTMGIAADYMSEKESKQIIEIKNKLLSVTSIIEDVTVNGDVNGSPFILNMSFNGIKGETLVNSLASVGIYISEGAACSSKKKGNRVLEAMGIDKAGVESAVRFSFSHFNTIEEVERCIQALIQHVPVLRGHRMKCPARTK